MNRTALRLVAATVALTGLSACGVMQDSQAMQPEFWKFGKITTNKAEQNTAAELGLAELSKGNNVVANAHFERALQSDPADAYALYGLAILYQNTGQPQRAAELYEQLLAIQPQPMEEILVWSDKQTQPLVNLAQVNLDLLKSGAMTSMPGVPMPSQAMAQPGAPQPIAVSPMGAQPGLYGQQPMPPQASMASAADPVMSDADKNIMARFKVIRALLDQGLITQEEFVQRRQTNVGALMPLSSKPAAAGMDRPVPAVEQITARLGAINRALEMRALTPSQHMAERTMILDALMPAQPQSVANPPPPPKGLMEAADAVRRLEIFKADDLITSDEYATERQAIETAMQPGGMKPGAAAATAVQPKAAAGAGGQALTGFQPGVHLASFRQAGAAERGWAELIKRFSQLQGLTMLVEKVDLGNVKGVFYRLKAGPLPSDAAAQDLCRQLKAKKQFCEPTTVNMG